MKVTLINKVKNLKLLKRSCTEVLTRLNVLLWTCSCKDLFRHRMICAMEGKSMKRIDFGFLTIPLIFTATEISRNISQGGSVLAFKL